MISINLLAVVFVIFSTQAQLNKLPTEPVRDCDEFNAIMETIAINVTELFESAKPENLTHKGHFAREFLLPFSQGVVTDVFLHPSLVVRTITHGRPSDRFILVFGATYLDENGVPHPSCGVWLTRDFLPLSEE